MDGYPLKIVLINELDEFFIQIDQIESNPLNNFSI